MAVNFIAEVSSNHAKDLDRALRFVDIAAEAGCDSVKFQLFKIDQLFAPEVLKQSKKIRDRRTWELPSDFLPILAARCKKQDIKFSCTPFYLEAVEELEPYVDFYKIASYELLWDDLLVACARTNKQVIISTGMATIEEIKHAVEVLRRNDCEPTVLHCTSAYPTPHYDANLGALAEIAAETGCEVGWSDHTVSPGVIFRAVHKWGAKVVEFHLDLDGEGAEFEAGHCWLPHQIEAVISEIKVGDEADGSGRKVPADSEIPERMWRADPSDGLRPMKGIRFSDDLKIN